VPSVLPYLFANLYHFCHWSGAALLFMRHHLFTNVSGSLGFWCISGKSPFFGRIVEEIRRMPNYCQLAVNAFLLSYVLLLCPPTTNCDHSFRNSRLDCTLAQYLRLRTIFPGTFPISLLRRCRTYDLRIIASRTVVTYAYVGLSLAGSLLDNVHDEESLGSVQFSLPSRSRGISIYVFNIISKFPNNNVC
jgi:hypothetical protein